MVNLRFFSPLLPAPQQNYKLFNKSNLFQDKIEIMLYFYHRRYTFTAAEFFILDLTILFSVRSIYIPLVLLLKYNYKFLLVFQMFSAIITFITILV